MNKNIEIWTDGAASPNPGDGGWAAILKYGDKEKEIFGAEENTTNNRMEMLAAIKALELIKVSASICIYTDSEYLANAFNKKWLIKWKKTGWKTSKGSAVLNQDLWNKLLDLCTPHTVEWKWVRGHDINEYNNRCDALAVAARLELRNGRNLQS